MTGWQTPSQTVGPFFALGLTAEQYDYPYTSIAGPDLTTADTVGTRITITGHVHDGEGWPVADAMVEIWQADADGNYPGPDSNTGFTGFGRAGTGTDANSRFVFNTIMPGATADDHTPHIDVIVFMRGALNHLFTRLYFPEHSAAHARDPVLASVPAARRHTLIAKTDGDAAYKFDIHMQGENETVFFDL